MADRRSILQALVEIDFLRDFSFGVGFDFAIEFRLEFLDDAGRERGSLREEPTSSRDHEDQLKIMLELAS